MAYPGMPPDHMAAGLAQNPGLVVANGAMLGHNPAMMAPPGDMVQQYHQEHPVPGMYAEPPPLDVEYQPIHKVMVDGGDRFGVTAVSFDAQEELIWMGNSGGHVTSYYGMDMQKHRSFQVHPSTTATPVLNLLTVDGRVLSLTYDALVVSAKQGRHLHTFRGETFHDMQCMLLTGPEQCLIGGHQNKVLTYDLNSMQQVHEAEVDEPGCAIFRYSSHFICVGDTSGKVTLRDPRSLSAEHILKAHSGTLCDFDVHDNELITCGFSDRTGSLLPDRFLMVYDLRMMRAVSPMQMTFDPMFLRFVPNFSNRICVVSQGGQLQLLEAGALTPTTMHMSHIHNEGAPVMAMDVSSLCNLMLFGDGGGYVHLHSNNSHETFNRFSTPTEFADHVELMHHISINDELTPYSIIPMQYPSNGTLLSDWPAEWCQRIYRKHVPVDAELMRGVKMTQNVGYVPNPGTRHRNQSPYKMPTKGKTRKANVPDSPGARGTADDPFVVVPKRYRKVEIKYSKLGVEDFDFRFYNKTNYAGLETHIPNAYCNSMLQMLYFIEPLRRALLNHLCDKEFCLTCELSFLFHMFDEQKGKTCQASNFLRAFRTIPEASALGLVLGDAEETAGKANIPRLIQSWNRFILQQIHTEINDAIAESERREKEAEEGSKPEEKKSSKPPTPEEKKEYDTIITQMFSSTATNRFRCRCGEEITREVKPSLYDLSYPDYMSQGSKSPVLVRFSQVVQNTMSLEQSTQAWCNNCNKYQPHIQSRTIQSLPDVLVFNCKLENAKDIEFWRTQQELSMKAYVESDEYVPPMVTQHPVKMCRYGNACTRKDCKFGHEGREPKVDDFLEKVKISDEPPEAPGWLPFGLTVRLGPDNQLQVQDASDPDSFPKEWKEENLVYYELLGNISHVKDTKTGGNLVNCIKVGETYHQRKEKVTCTQWYIFNDFSITPVEKYEAVHFNLDWNLPCAIYFIRRNLHKKHEITVRNPISKEVLFVNESVVTPRRRHMTFTPLDSVEVPKKGDVVGLDAEFVTLNQEEAELRSDGTRSTIKPSQMSVARITCIRGRGPLEGEPFIDDYISTSEQVVDYLTQFSGIKPGDLDASISSKHLTTLKSTYLKLRYLIDAGVVFVGHGLKKDFRVCNLVVPKDQVIDTVELFHMPRQRMISLKFLAWFFLKQRIQSVTHDSIEDARTALKLYECYKQLSVDGTDNFKQVLKEMYEKGRTLQWKIPETDE